MSDRLLLDALDDLVPRCEDAFGDWSDVLARAHVTTSATTARDATRRRYLTKRRLAIAGLLLAAVVALLATPAFGIRGLISDLFGRKNVHFNGQQAPLPVKRDFSDLSLGAPPGMDPGAIASQARKVATFRIDGKAHVLWVAPTRSGGLCETFTDMFGGCRKSRTPPKRYPRGPGAVNPFLLGLTWTGSPATLVGGDILAPNAQTLLVEYENNATSPIPFVFVSKPIDAGFFLYKIPAGHTKAGTRVRAVLVRDAHGRLLARVPIVVPPVHRPPTVTTPAPPPSRTPAYPPPSAPIQRGSQEGVTVQAGSNGVVVFDTKHASAAVRHLIGGKGAGYGCFRFEAPYHRDVPAELLFARQTLRGNAIRIFGLARPYDGCEVEGGYGHTWPDRNHSHSAVEIALTPRGRRYFADRAAARDLALLVRSHAMQKIRRLTGSALTSAIGTRYGSKLTRLPSPTSTLRPLRIGYATSAATATFVEYSPTGRRFYALIRNGRVAKTNVNGIAFVF